MKKVLLVGCFLFVGSAMAQWNEASGGGYESSNPTLGPSSPAKTNAPVTIPENGGWNDRSISPISDLVPNPSPVVPCPKLGPVNPIGFNDKN